MKDESKSRERLIQELEKARKQNAEPGQSSSDSRPERERARLIAIMESTSDLVATTKPDGQGIYMNAAGLRLLGYSENEDVGMHNLIEVHPEWAYRIVMDEGIPGALKNGVWKGETALLTKDGREIPVSQVIMAHRSPNGEPEYISTIIRDISDQKRTEEALRISENKYRRLHESMRDAFVSVDMEGHIIDYNQSYLNMLGYSPEELNLLTYKDVTPEKWHEMEDTIINTQILTRGYSDIYEKEYCRKDGTVFPVEFRTLLIRDDAGTPVSMWAIVRDITERKRIEEKIRRSEERFRSYFDLPIIGIAMTSPEKGWIEVNDRMCDIVGYPRNELVNMTWAELTHPDDLENDNAQFQRVLSGEIDGYSLDKRFIRKDGKPVWTSLSVRCVRLADGRPDYFVALIQDINDRKKAEEEISRFNVELEKLVRERTAELENKNRDLLNEIAERIKAENEKSRIESQLAQAQRIEALDRFAGGIAHDLNNILTPIIINIEELLEESPRGSRQHDILDQTLKAAYRQRDLVKKILSFGRRSERILKPIRVKPLLEEIINFLKSSLPSTTSIRQTIDVQTDVIMGDPVQIQQIVMNLCQNAADALESRKGIIEIGLANTHMRSLNAHEDAKAGDYLKLTVKDSGHGMKSEVMDRVFEPFFTSKGVGKGTGLGLSVVHGIVKSLGRTITVESAEGKGSLFTVYLPVSKALYKDQPSHTHGTLKARGREKILLVDDEEIVLSSLQRILSLSGYRVTALKDGMEAFNLFYQDPEGFDLVITDLTMPGMTGLEFAGKLQKVRYDIPIILCTGYNDVISREEAKSFGIRELLLKPASARELKDTIRRVIENRYNR